MSESQEEELKEKILNLARKNPKGITDNDITTAIPDLTSAELVTTINKLLQQGCFDIYKQGGSLVYR